MLHVQSRHFHKEKNDLGKRIISHRIGLVECHFDSIIFLFDDFITFNNDQLTLGLENSEKNILIHISELK